MSMSAFSRGDIHYAPISAASNGANTIVAGVAGKRIRVINWLVKTAGEVNLTVKSNTTALTGPIPLNADGVGGSQCITAHFATAHGEALVFALDAAVGAYGYLSYILTDD